MGGQNAMGDQNAKGDQNAMGDQSVMGDLNAMGDLGTSQAASWGAGFGPACIFKESLSSRPLGNLTVIFYTSGLILATPLTSAVIGTCNLIPSGERLGRQPSPAFD